MNRDEIAQIFDDCDQKRRGYIEFDDLSRNFGHQISDDHLSLIFDKLDEDRDGRVYKNDFLSQFFSVRNADGGVEESSAANVEPKSPPAAATVGNFLHGLRRRNSAAAADVVASLTTAGGSLSFGDSGGAKKLENKDENNNNNDSKRNNKNRKMMIRRSTNITESLYFRLTVEDMGADFALISKEQQEIIFEFYEDLQKFGAETPLLNHFEKMIANFCREIKNYKDMSDKMFNIHQREKQSHAKQMLDIENDLEQQLILIRERIKKEEKEKFENEKETLRQEYETEMHDLRDKMNYLQKIVDIRSNDDENSNAVSETKAKIQDIKKENRQLKSTLVEKNTELAVVRSYLAKLRREYEQKCLNLDLELSSTQDLDAEKRHYEKQMQILQDVNKVLYDANDNLLVALESRGLLFPPKNVRSSSPLPMPSDYASSDGESFASYRYPVPNQTLTTQANRSTSNARFGGGGASCCGDTDDDVDSGVLSNRPTCSNCYSAVENENDAVCTKCRCENTHFFVENSTKKRTKSGKNHADAVAAPSCAHKNYIDDKTIGKQQSMPCPAVQPAANDHDQDKNQLNTIPKNGPERTFRIVMVGDSGVGKSSLIMRLVKDVYKSSLQSTLGVDFHVKMMHIDGNVVALQLWDTAGQEKFKSVCSSYFRRADGAILLYDCTCERSFLNVRNWIQTIQQYSQKDIPLLICASKVDLRNDAKNVAKFVQKEEGERLAKSVGAMFLETSSKNNFNVHTVAYELTRVLLSLENCEVKSSLILPLSTDDEKRPYSSRCTC